MSRDDEKQARLAEALRANLRRRKAQARGQTGGGDENGRNDTDATKQAPGD
ncbi:hypothetical protein [Tardibacter chloracetimidivorans]|uniref:hypothetical protein n=1 Tax=Tardibacter chloracetimidivorans TaxID=1921510 RepID=UPI00187364CC|nr:hypothetical protein [Tardibacter chloracetimidivorans]